MRCSPEQKARRENIVRAIQFSKASKYVPLMFECADAHLNALKDGEIIDVQELNGNILFTIIARIIFGSDIDLQKTYPY